MKKETNIEKVAKILKVDFDSFSDESASWIEFNGKDYSVTLEFDGKGNRFESVSVSKREWAVVNEPIVETIKP